MSSPKSNFTYKLKTWATSGRLSAQIAVLLLIPIIMAYVMSGILFPFLFYALIQDWPEIRGTYWIDSTQWQTTTGTILDGRIYDRYISRVGTRYYYQIHYRYTVRDQAFESSQVTFTERGSVNPAFAEGYLSKYPVGKEIVVYYLPNDPAFAVLEPDQRGHYFGQLAFTLLGLICAISYLVDKAQTFASRRKPGKQALYPFR